MIATCPHCKNGFYIVPDMAGEVVTCSKCKKNGIPVAAIEETREEMEERLKIEAEARMEAETKLAEVEGAKVKAEELSRQQGEKLAQLERELKELTETKASLVERLKTVGEAQADGQKSNLIEAEITAREKAERAARELESKILALEEELKTRMTAKEQTEQQLRDAEKRVPEAEQKYQQEARAHQATQMKLSAESQAKAGVEAQLKTEIERRTKAENELKDKSELAEQVGKQQESISRLEAQLKAETGARLRSQAQLEQEVEKRNKMQKEVVMMQMQADAHKEIKIVEQPRDYQKGPLRLAMVLSVMAAIAGGVFEYNNGYVNYIINRYFDTSAILPFFNKPHLVPMNLVLFAVAGFIAVWVLYLPVWFVISGFCSAPKATARIPKKEAMPDETQNEPQPQFAHGMWRS
ncbi:MAG: hypothetical protein ABSH16_13850 [Sedimentisphaerales bacterium]